MEERRQVVDEIAAHYVQLGLSGTASRVLGELVLEPDGSLDAPTLVERLGVAKSSLSVAIATLERYGLVRRSRRPGERRERCTVADDVFEAAFLSKLPALGAFVELAGRGLEVVEPGTDAARRLARMRAFYAFMLREFPVLLERWRAESSSAAPTASTPVTP